MERLIRFKKILVSKVSIREMTHYHFALNNRIPCSPRKQQGKDIDIKYHAYLPRELADIFNIHRKIMNKEGSSCVVAYYKDEPAGCMLLNSDGYGKMLEPFEYDVHFGSDHAYAHNLLVKQEFRGKGLSKLMYHTAIEKLKNTHTYLDVLVDNKNFISNRSVQTLGFTMVGRRVFVRFFGYHAMISLNNPLKSEFFAITMKCLKLIKICVELPLSIVRAAWEIKSSRILNVYHIHNDSMRIKYVSKGLDERMLINRILGLGYHIEKVRAISRKKIRDEFVNPCSGIDIVIADDNFDYLHKELSGFDNVIFMPQWIAQRNNAFNGLDEFTRQKHRSASEDIRITKKNDFEYIFTREPDLVSFFYEHMYLPFIHNRYENEKVVSSFERLKKSVKRGGLLLLKQNGRHISGSVIELTHRTVHPTHIGVLHGNAELVKNHAVIALYYFYLKLAEEKRFRRIDFGLSRPFLNDGVLKYKLKWDPEISFSKKRCNVFAIKICDFSEPVNEFLINNPFISLEKSRLIGNIFAPAGGELDKEALTKQYSYKGLSGINING